MNIESPTLQAVWPEASWLAVFGILCSPQELLHCETTCRGEPNNVPHCLLMRAGYLGCGVLCMLMLCQTRLQRSMDALPPAKIAQQMRSLCASCVDQ